MAFPFVFQSSWETGAIQWDSETDTGGQLDIAHYTQLAQQAYGNCAPFTGAYCLRLQLTGGTADAYLDEADINISANTTNYFHFNIWFSQDFTGTADDTFNILELLASSTVEATFGARIVNSTNAINLGIGETAPTTFGGNIERGRWYTVELVVDVDNAGNNDGTIDIYVTPEGQQTNSSKYAAQVGSLDQGAITDGRLGIQDHLGTTTGTILIDNFIQDDAQIYASRRFMTNRIITDSGHAFIGPGKFKVALLSGAGTDNVLTVYDTDRANSDNQADVVLELKNTANNQRTEADDPVCVTRGAYIVLSGTNPRAQIQILRASHYTSGSQRHYGMRAA